MSFSTNLQAVSLRLLTTYGQNITFTRENSSEYDVSTGGVSVVTNTTYTAYGHPSTFRIDEIDGTIVQNGDIALLTYSSTYTPAINDVATISGDVYRVMNVEIFNAQGNSVLYRLQMRR